MKLFACLQKLLQGRRENRTCYLCRKEIFDGKTFCADCRRILPYPLSFCARCGRKMTGTGICTECRARLPVADKIRSVFVYEDVLRGLIRAFKEDDPAMADGFAREMLPILEREFSACDFLTFVPMTRAAVKKRGYNQSERLARALSALCGIPVEEVFEKKRDTDEQKSLGRAEREKNLRGAFALKKRAVCRDKKILLIDDVMTTGSTTDELAKLLRGAHAAKVWVLTVAATPCFEKKTSSPEKIFARQK